MKTVVFTVLSLVGLALIWVGDLRLMLTGIFLAIDVVGAQIYFGLVTLDERLHAAEDRLSNYVGSRLDNLEKQLQSGE